MYARLAHGMQHRAMAPAASDAVSVARAVQAYTYGAGRCYGRMLFSGSVGCEHHLARPHMMGVRGAAGARTDPKPSVVGCKGQYHGCRHWRACWYVAVWPAQELQQQHADGHSHTAHQARWTPMPRCLLTALACGLV